MPPADPVPLDPALRAPARPDPALPVQEPVDLVLLGLEPADPPQADRPPARPAARIPTPTTMTTT